MCDTYQLVIISRDAGIIFPGAMHQGINTKHRLKNRRGDKLCFK
jgi:hypothetical protein